jgi:head-to-tail connecting protein
MLDGKAEKKRYQALLGDAHNHRAQWDIMAPFIAPSRVGVLTQYADGEKQTRGVTDSTSMMAAELMSFFVAGHTINPSQKWGGMTMPHPNGRDNDAIQEWLDESGDRMLRAFANSLFYAEGPESLIDWGGFGTGFLLGEEAPAASNKTQRGFRGFVWHAEKTGRFVIADGVDGLVDTAYREFKLAARVIRDRWPDAKLPEKITQAIANGKPDQAFTILHAIVPRSKADQQKGAGATAMPWASGWIEFDSADVIHESGYRVFPAAVPRYMRTPGEVFGRGRGHLAFPDTWTLNTAKRMGFQDWALKIQPPVLMRHDSVIGTLKLVPAGPTSVNTRGGSIQDSIMPYQTGSNPQVSQIKEEELRKSIRQIFFVDQILALMEVNKSEMTAFEFAKKMQLLFSLMGPVYGRMEKEFLRRVWDIGFDVMFHAGAFSPPPPEIFDTDGFIDVTFQNPIARAQRTGDVEAIQMAIADIAPMAAMFPDMWDRFNRDKTVQRIFEVRGVPATVANNDDEVAQIRDARQAAQEKEAQLAETEQIATAAGKAAPALTALQGGKAA